MSNLLLFGANFIVRGLMHICFLIDGVVYTFVDWIYRVFYMVSTAEIFESGAGNTMIEEITDRVYVVLGVVMLFVLAYNILNAIVDPDKLTGKNSELKGVAYRLLLAVVLLAVIPTIFTYINKAQSHLISSCAIPNIVMGKAGTCDSASTRGAGRHVAVSIFSAFLYPIDADGKSIIAKSDCSGNVACETYFDAMEKAIEDGDYVQLFSKDLLKGVNEKPGIKYYPIFSLIGAIYASYMFLSFAIDMGVRAVKLGVLRIIAPVPIASYITKPKGGTFDRWLKEITKTYYELFTRLGVIYFSLAIISNLNKLDLWQNRGDSFVSPASTLANVIIILGALTFAKDAPKMFESLFNIEHFETNIKKKLNDNEYAKRLSTAGLALGGSAIRKFNKIRDAVKGAQINKNYKHLTPKGRKALLRQARFEAGAKAWKSSFGDSTKSVVKGWQNGNVDSLGSVVNAAIDSMAQGASATPLKDFFQGVNNIPDSINDFVSGKTVTSYEVQSVTEANSFLKKFVDFLTNGDLEKAMKETLNGFDTGSFKLSRNVSFTDAAGNNITLVAGTEYNEQMIRDMTNGSDASVAAARAAIKSDFENRQKAYRDNKFSDPNNSAVLESMMGNVVDSLNKLTSPDRDKALADVGLKMEKLVEIRDALRDGRNVDLGDSIAKIVSLQSGLDSLQKDKQNRSSSGNSVSTGKTGDK